MNYIFFIIICMCAAIFPVKKLRKVAIIIILLTFLTVIVLYPDDTISSAKSGIILWLNIVIPSLLPFFIINDMLISLKVPENIAYIFKPAAKILFKTSGYGAYVFIMSIFSGYPSGAKIVSQLIHEKKITPEEGQKILTFSSTSGPLFIIGAVGTGMMGSAQIGYILFLSHILGSIINGIFSGLIFRQKEYREIQPVNLQKPFTGDILSNSIINSLYSCGIIGGYIIIFSTIIKLIDSISFLNIFISITDNFISLSASKAEMICTFIKSLLEISNGCRVISLSSGNLPLKLVLISFIISFSGLSVIGQVSSIISNTGLKLKTYILFKITQGFFSSIICYLLLNTKISIPAFDFNMYSKISISNNILINIQIYLLIIIILNTFYYIKKRLK